jgi:hypothetical protein
MSPTTRPTRRRPRSEGPGPSFFPSRGEERTRPFGNLCFDYNDAASGKRFLPFTGPRILAIAFDSI